MEGKSHPNDEARLALQSINWTFLVLYCVVAVFIFFAEQRENFFYALPFRYYFGIMAVPAYIPVWFGLLLGDLIHQFRWRSLAGILAAGISMIMAYAVINSWTVTLG